ncbi:MAG: LysM peptidoglycan-binding domain-containing protein [Flavobacteriales bacterium]|nr:LysM peptidoglycan-binding domain-containing protein [Flavobacteriales bacterium]
MLLLLPTASFSQETRTIDGKKFAVHAVQQGQTLFAISRAYAVPVNDLLKANPDAKEGLRIGQELLIPQSAVVKKEARKAPVLLSDGEMKHTAAKKETLFGIARKYGLDINDLLDRNPELTSGLREGMEVIIPVRPASASTDPALRPAEPTHLIDHVVQPGETLFSLGQRYGVRPDEIVEANNSLPEGLKAGTTIRIPQRGAAPETKPADTEVRPPSAMQRIGFLLPFSAARNDSVMVASANAPNGSRFYEASRIAAQFYAGAQLALDSLAKIGLNAEATVIDVGDDTRRWGVALKNPAINGLDLCIGPFHRTAIEQLARANPRLPIICPVPQSNKVVLGLPNVSKTVPARSDLVKHAARHVAAKHARDNIIVLRPDIAGDKDIQEQMSTTMNASLASMPVRYRDSVLVMKPGRRDIGDLAAKLDANRLNVIVAPSEDVEFVTAIVGKLKGLAAKHQVLVVGVESWLSMDPVAAADLDLLGFTFASGTFADPADAAIQRFTRAFRQRFNTDIDEYALLGFDVTMHYGLELLGQSTAEPALHMGFRMSRTGPENGQRNEHGIMLRMRDLRLERAQ